MTVIFDQPVRVGDFCQVGETLGTIEQIGIRSTRIRTLDRTLVTIPNGDFSAQKIENYAHRDKFRFYSVVGLVYETTVITSYSIHYTKLYERGAATVGSATGVKS